MTTACTEFASPMAADPNKRREERYALQVRAILRRSTGGTITASTINVSGSGVLLDLPDPGDLRVGEEVSCSLELYEGKPPQAWGVGKVVRIDGAQLAVVFTGL